MLQRRVRERHSQLRAPADRLVIVLGEKLRRLDLATNREHVLAPWNIMRCVRVRAFAVRALYYMLYTTI